MSMGDEIQALTSAEQADLEQQEAIIARGLQTFWEVGQALARIRDRRLYRHEYPNFEAYVQARWQLSRFYAHRLIEAAAVREQLLPIGNIAPENEAQVRPLTRLRDAQIRRQVWQEVADAASAQGKPVTAALVRAVVSRHVAAPTRPKEDDLAPSSAEPETIAEAEALLLERGRQYGRATGAARRTTQVQLLQAAKHLVKLDDAPSHAG